MDINGYKLKAELKNANSGFSKWGFAEKNGKEYFIKELISPVYPIDRHALSDEAFMRRQSLCLKYEEKFKRYYTAINTASRGNLVRITEFFRCGSRYYLINEKINGKSITPELILSLDFNKKLLLLKSAAHALHALHSAGIVHFDIKPSNILVKETAEKTLVAKLIDFDSGFFKSEPPDNDELVGDLAYLAPESYLKMCGNKVEINEKADIFALGLIFHLYWCARLPYWDKNEYSYPYEAALDGGILVPDADITPDEIKELIMSMLDVDPDKRPSAEEIIIRLNSLTRDRSVSEIPPTKEHKDSDWFRPAGDL